MFAVTWRYVVGIIESEDLPMRAAELLAAGMDSPALRDLAGRGRREITRELAELFRQAVHEVGQSMLSQETGERCLLHHLAGRLTAGTKTPGNVVARIWRSPTSAQTGAEREFLQAVGDEYYVDYIAYQQPDAFRAWETELRYAAQQLSRTPAAEIHALLEEPSDGDCRPQ